MHDYFLQHSDQISDAGWLIYCTLHRHSNPHEKMAHIGIQALCLKTRKSRTTVYRLMRILEEFGMIKKLPKREGGFVIYVEHFPPKLVRESSGSLPLLDIMNGEQGENLDSPKNGTESRKRDEPVPSMGQSSPKNGTANKVLQKESNTQSYTPSADADEIPDSPPGEPTQHDIVRKYIQEKYVAANGRRCPWDGRTGKVLNTTLDRLGWENSALLEAIDHRFASDVVLSEEPVNWLPRLASYAAGPLNQFNKPANGNGGQKHANQKYIDRAEREAEILRATATGNSADIGF